MFKNPPITSLLLKKNTVENFFEIKGCSLSGTPYNAPPLTGNNEIDFAGLGREKNQFEFERKQIK
ncbi:TPA: hypothetical protein ACGTP8_003662, partial [Yersinia enterocolitica]